MSLQRDLDRLLVSESCQFNKAMAMDEWFELVEWCNTTFGKNNWFFEKGVMKFNGCCPENSSTLFLLRWS